MVTSFFASFSKTFFKGLHCQSTRCNGESIYRRAGSGGAGCAVHPVAASSSIPGFLIDLCKFVFMDSTGSHHGVRG